MKVKKVIPQKRIFSRVVITKALEDVKPGDIVKFVQIKKTRVCDCGAENSFVRKDKKWYCTSCAAYYSGNPPWNYKE